MLHDALKKKGMLQETGAPDIETGREKEFTLSRLIIRAAKYPVNNPIIGMTEREGAWRVKDGAEKILHLRDRSGSGEVTVTEDEAFDLVRDTIKVVEAVISR